MSMERRTFLAAAASAMGTSAVRTGNAATLTAADMGKREPFTLNIREFGAMGDGTTDDTRAFQTTLDVCGQRGGGIVEVPTGTYLIKAHLSIPPAVTLEGVFRAPPTYRSDYLGRVGPFWDLGPGKLDGSVLLAVEGAGRADGVPFITLNTNSTLKGLSIFYPDQTDAHRPRAYPWAVAVAAGGATNPAILDVLMINPYQAVDFGSYSSPRSLIRNLYADALLHGIYIDNCLDMSRLENVHLWPFWQRSDGAWPPSNFSYKNGRAFIIGRADWLHLQNCFAILYKVGFEFGKTAPAGVTRAGPSPQLQSQLKEADYPSGNVVMTGGGIDVSDTAVLVEDSFPLEGISFVNSLFAGRIAIKQTNRGMVRFTSCGFVNVSDNDMPMVETGGVGRVSFSNCSFDSAAGFHRGIRANFLHAISGSVGLVNCTFTSADIKPRDSQKPSHVGANTEQVIVIEPAVRSAIILGNDFSGHAVITHNSNANVEIANNTEQTEQ